MTDTEQRGLVIAVAYTKGGATKSTSTTNIAAELARQGFDVLIIDADKQRTSAKWVERREDAIDDGAKLARIHCIEKLGNIKPAIIDAAGRYDVVLIDSAGRDSKELRISIMWADLTLVPIQASQADLEAMEDMAEIIESTDGMNPDRKILAFLTCAENTPGTSSLTEAKDFLSDYPEVEVMRSKIHNRKVYKEALKNGTGVIEESNSKAKAEVQVLTKEMMSHA